MLMLIGVYVIIEEIIDAVLSFWCDLYWYNEYLAAVEKL